MKRQVEIRCWAYASKEVIFEEWKKNLKVGELASSVIYAPILRPDTLYGFKDTEQGWIKKHPFEAETIEDIFRMHLYGNSAKDISEKLTNYKYPVPGGLNQWSTGMIMEILRNECYTGYKFISEKDRIIVQSTGCSIIPKRLFAIAQELQSLDIKISQNDRLISLARLLL